MSDKIIQLNKDLIMYLAGVSVRRVEDITEALWGNESISRNNQ